MPKATENQDRLTAVERAAVAAAAPSSTVKIFVGDGGATDNRLVRTDGTGGQTLQSTGITVSDANAISGVAGLTVASGNVTLTTGNIVLSQAGATVDGRDLTTDGANLDAFRILTIATSAEGAGPPAANTIRVTYQVKDFAGANVAAVHRLRAKLFSAAMVELATAAATVSVVTGTAVSTDAQADLIAETDATGLLVVDVLDVSGALAAAMNLMTTFVVVSGGATNAARVYHTVLTFA